MSGGAGPTTAVRLLGMSTRPSRLVFAIAVAGLAATLASCSPTTFSIAPTGTIEPTAAPASEPPASDPGASDPGATPRTTQTETTWGRIWDDLPDGFPLYPGATVADDATAEPVSGVVAIAGGDPATVATWMQAALESSTYSTEALSGPFEDGSVVLDSVGVGGCRIQTVVAPVGGLTLMTIRYGAACPHR